MDTTPMPVRLGVYVACRAAHQASLADATGKLMFSGRKFHTRPEELERLWAQLPEGAEVMVVPPEQSADLRDYYNKHTKTDRLDSRVLARLPLLHPDGELVEVDELGPADPLRRAVRRRSSLVERRTGCFNAWMRSWSYSDRRGRTRLGPAATARPPWRCWNATPTRERSSGPAAVG
jgi:hypothetical protein